ncbi:MAG: Na+:solute symporter [Gemmatimonadota bacterium]
MRLAALDWLVIASYGVLTLALGLRFAGRAGRGTQEFFLSGRTLPWWLLGTSMVATTFSTDTPNLVTDLVRTGGVSANWVWWAFLVTGMCTVFFYARLWRRSGVFTDMGFYELRYSGRPAAFLRGFRALYLGVFFNVMIMAAVTLAAIKIGGVLLGLDRYATVLVAGGITVVYSAGAGLWGVVVTDLLLFIVAMVGSIAAAVYALRQPEVGGLSGLVSNPAITDRLPLLPDFTDWRIAVPIFVIPLAVQWWSTWYPGAEPGGGGYVAQRMLAARDERESMRAVLWFNLAHYALRPWPWILVALASLAVYPTLDSLAVAFPHVEATILRDDLAYPAMLVFLPTGLLGLVVASLGAAYMSTISTHLNWGASYIVEDFYRRFLAPNREERHALQAFQILLQIGAGTGSIFLLRWFWWRVNAWSEISGMVVSFAVAVWFQFLHARVGLAPLHPSAQLLIGVAVTSAVWLTVTWLTPPADRETLQSYYDRIRPYGRGWARVVDTSGGAPAAGGVAAGLAGWFLGCGAVYAALFATGYLLYGRPVAAAAAGFVAGVSALGLFRVLPRVSFD